MMPGDSQSKMVAIAADATVGNCQNCSVLHQSLNEYVSSFLALKQKITVSDNTVRLQQQIKDLQARLISLEKKTSDYESLEAELQEKKDAFKVYEQMSEEVEKLKQENTEINSENEKLKNEIKNVKECVEARTLENAQLRREKAEVENNLLDTQSSLKKVQLQAEQAEKLIKENAEVTSIKDNLQIKVKLLEESVSKQNHQISQLSIEKSLLERNIDDLQKRILKLERERCKEYKSTYTQASVPEEPKVDKEKFRLLLNNLWACVEPGHSSDNITGSPCKRLLSSPPQNKPFLQMNDTTDSAFPKIQSPNSQAKYTKLKTSPDLQRVSEQQEYQHCTISRKQTSKTCKKSPKKQKAEELPLTSCDISFEEIMELFKPLLPCLSPIQEMDTSMDSMDVTDGEDVTCKPSLQLKQKLSVPDTTTSLTDQCPESTETLENVKLPEVTIQEHNNSSKNLENSELLQSNHSEKTSGHDTLQDYKTSESVTSTLSSLPNESPKPYCLDVKNNIGNEEVPCSNKDLEKTTLSEQGELEENITDMDVSEIQPSDIEEKPTEDDTLLEGPQCTSITAPVQDLDTDNDIIDITDTASCNSSMEVDHQDTAHHKDSGGVCLSEADVNKCSESNQKPQANAENEDKINNKDNTDDDDGAERTIDYTLSHLECEEIHKSPKAGQEPTNVTSTTPLTRDGDLMAANSEVTGCQSLPATVQETETTDSQPVKTSHTLCQQLASSCFQPASKLQKFKNKPETVKVEHFSVNNVATLTEPSKEAFEENAIGKNKQDKSLTKSLTKEATDVREEPSSNITVRQSAPQEFIGQVRSEMGPPLPPLLTPVYTPPKAGKRPLRNAIGKLSFPSPMDTSNFNSNTPVETCFTPNGSQTFSGVNSPFCQNGVPSSPLQFGSATPKHAVPVPGRLPPTMNSSPSSSCSPSQETSMRFLDTMYPEMSARARTLSILKGNVNLNLCSPDSGTTPAENKTSSFKSINSASTAFTKTETRGAKRALSLPQPKDNKVLRLDSPVPLQSPNQLPLPSHSKDDKDVTLLEHNQNETFLSIEEETTAPPKVTTLLNKIEDECFDLLPVIQSHLFVGNLPKKPVLREEEKEVISVICHSNTPPAHIMMSAIEQRIKQKKKYLGTNQLQALCRVFIGICRQRKDWQRAHILAYSILLEDYPDAAKMILFMITTWPSVLSHNSLLCQALHAVTKLKTPNELLSCMSAYLGWDKKPPCEIDAIISQTMSEIRSGSMLSFVKHDKYGSDLGLEAWQHVFTLQLLCAQREWKWTYENLLSKELWPVMNTWVTQSRDQQVPISDITIATVLRLIGRLGQLGIKQKRVSSVMTVASVINTFGQHGHSEGVPWEVQLAAIYCIYDLSPCNPKSALKALAGWRQQTSQKVPPGITSCITQLGSVCRQVKS